MNIKRITGLEILDSRGNPTIKAFVELENGIVGTAAVPSGASTGSHEAVEVRDNDQRYNGLGVQKAIDHINTTINPLLTGNNIDDLKALDMLMLEADGTPQKTKLGANSILAVSMALVRTLSLEKKEPLWQILHRYYFSNTNPGFPRLMVNVINGGAHAQWNLDIQEYMIIPKDTTPSLAVQKASEIFHALKELLKEKSLSTNVGDEGGFAPMLENNTAALGLLQQAVERAGYNKDDVDLGLDVAASEMYKEGRYRLTKDNANLNAEELSAWYDSLIASHNILSIEDPFAEDDWESFTNLTNRYGSTHNIVGDDLLVTNVERIKKGIEHHAANTVLIKLNQIGSVFETVQAILLARKAGWKIIISHRSGETEDSFIADLAFACSAEFIKSGSMSRSDRLAKYNRLLEIEAREFSQ